MSNTDSAFMKELKKNVEEAAAKIADVVVAMEKKERSRKLKKRQPPPAFTRDQLLMVHATALGMASNGINRVPYAIADALKTELAGNLAKAMKVNFAGAMEKAVEKVRAEMMQKGR